ncbi:hypothetical protein CXB49_16060 [Chromobacterium sp. ATCC 53434]|uniref:polyketide synthase n=1 Tax=Chromobacterium sp. (strain ATCC 53434 / SC 14030) TaxID=2059672 RepID=UPI000C75743C|nr:polyketide synthase [Chromobacterium sp. ATCC 53434]AUH52219.1 hypothetical protein CXB49_16060 [Chromobacterium sp. ATCC 53434]
MIDQTALVCDSVVQLSYPAAGVAQVSMRDHDERNMFSHALIEGLDRAFADIGACRDVKVVVVSGLDQYFCCGGTRSELLSLIEGEKTFDIGQFYRALLDCPLPTIAAMAGHAVGGGFVFGMYADIAILAEESVYSANFMRYGFTPGVGSTCLLPRRLGEALASEMLLSANGFTGRELSLRGAPFKVVKRAKVLEEALALAVDLAAKPQASLRMLKATLTRELREALPAAIARELDMHDVTFKLPEVRAQVERHFGH